MLAAMAFANVNAQETEGVNVTFDFTDPQSLNPAVPAPAVKEWIPLDGRTFTQDGVSVSFYATGSGNTQVRLYGSYDAGCNLRVYDGDSFTVASTNPEFGISEIIFDIALSGYTADVDVIPDTGEYEWLTNTWHSGQEPAERVTMVSNQQSRISTMTVKLAAIGGGDSTSAGIVAADNGECRWYDMQGNRISEPGARGIYLKCTPRGTEKVMVCGN